MDTSRLRCCLFFAEGGLSESISMSSKQGQFGIWLQFLGGESGKNMSVIRLVHWQTTLYTFCWLFNLKEDFINLLWFFVDLALHKEKLNW